MKKLMITLVLGISVNLFADVLPDSGYLYNVKVGPTLSRLLNDSTTFSETRKVTLNSKVFGQCEATIGVYKVDVTKESIECQDRQDCTPGGGTPTCTIKAFNTNGRITSMIEISRPQFVKLR